MAFLLLNPSTADAAKDDPTVRRCCGFAAREGAASIEIINLFAFRTPKPAALRAAKREGVDIVGPENRQWIDRVLADPHVTHVVAGWGAQGTLAEKLDSAWIDTLKTQLWLRGALSLGRTKAGHPCHPLYLPTDAALSFYP